MPLRGNSPSAPRPVEKKKCSAGRSACMRTSCRRRGMVGGPSRQSETETPSPWGSLQPGEVWDTSSSSFRCRSRSREEPGSAWRSVRRGKRSCSNAILHPDALRTIRHGTAASISQKTQACPKGSPNRSRHRYADPRARGGQLHRSALGAFFSSTGRGAFSFWRNQKEDGGCVPPWERPPAETPP